MTAFVYSEGDLANAKVLFAETITQAQAIHWQRAVIYTQNWLADITIQERRLAEAEELLSGGLPVADRNKDARRVAYYQRSYAKLAWARTEDELARRWALEAIHGFERLEMLQEVEEMQLLLIAYPTIP